MKRGIAAVALLVCTSAACAQSLPAPETASPAMTPPATIQPDATHSIPQQASPHSVMMKFGDPSIDQPWAEGQKALEERRWFRPVGNNAAEYYLQAQSAALKQTKVNPKYVEVTQEALRSLFPYVLMAAEGAVERNDKNEAERLISLLGKMDPAAPAVQRLNLIVNAPPVQELN